ncbi:MAG: phospholipase A [Betaproteobacteria bacterium]
MSAGDALRPWLSAAALIAASAGASAQVDLRVCAAVAEDASRLACYDRLAGRQPAPLAAPAAQAAGGGAVQAAQDGPAPAQPTATLLAQDAACKDRRLGAWSRFWELDSQSDCGTFHLRGYRPLSVSLVQADRVNRAPSSLAPGRSATKSTDYRSGEMRLQLSVRTKIASGLLTHDDPEQVDSLWFAYSQQSYWQIFSEHLSRPFRATDHEPELIYVYPLNLSLPGRWRVRYAGLGLVHQSNGQSLPLSRSWNRAYLMAGADLNERWLLTTRLWQRLPERAEDDDNPGISEGMGRAEMRLGWAVNRDHALSLTLRHAMHAGGRGSVRLEWFRGLASGSGPSELRLHTQLFSGYGDSLTDYNLRRTVLSVGLSLLDF